MSYRIVNLVFNLFFVSHSLLIIFTLIPSYQFIVKYRVTRVTELLYFAILFLTAAVAAINNLLGVETGLAIFYQMAVISINTGFLIIFIIAVRAIYIKTPKLIKYGTFIWFTILLTIILLWKSFTQPNHNP